MTSKTILVGYDGSESAQRAAAQACALAQKLNAGVLLAYSAHLNVPPYDFPMGVPAGDPVGDLSRYGDLLLNEAKLKLAACNVPLTTEVWTGAPAEMLAQRAGSSDIEWVVVGRSGRSAVSRFLMGSVTNRLAHICPKPMVVVP